MRKKLTDLTREEYNQAFKSGMFWEWYPKATGMFTVDVELMMPRCPKCHKENFAPNVLNNRCTWCGFDPETHSNIDWENRSTGVDKLS